MSQNTFDGRRLAVVMAAVYLMCSSVSVALSEDQMRAASFPNAIEMEEIVISGGKAEKKQSVPATINTVEPEAAKADAPSWIGETMNKVPGVYFARLRGVTDAPSIRFPVTYSNYYLYLQDNVPFQSPIAYNHAAFAYSAALTSFGGIEVLKGPGSALHGSDAFAAVINVKSEEPSDSFSTGGRIGGGSYGFGEARADVTGPITKTQSALGAASYQHEDGWRDNSAWDRVQGVARHKYKNDNGLELNTIGIGTYYTSEMAGALTQQQYDENPKQNGLQPGVPVKDAIDTETYFRLSSEANQKIGDATTLSVTPFVRSIDMQYMQVWFPDTTPVVNENQKTAGALMRLYHNFTDDSETIFGTDVDYTWYNYKEMQSRPTATVFGYFDSPEGTHYDFDVDYLGVSPYIQHTQKLGNWVVEPGVRFDSLQYKYDNKLDQNVSGSYFRRNDRTDTFSALNPKLGIAYKFTPERTAYARYAHGFRIPSVYDLYTLDTSMAEFTLDPEQIDSYEVGFKGVVNSKMVVESDVYYARSHDGLAVTSTPAGDIKANGGKNEYRGFELGLNYYPTSAVDVEAGYAFSAHKIVKQLADGSSPIDGNVPMESPKNLGNLRVTWRPAFVPKFSIQPEVQWIGKWWIDDANTKEKPNDVLWNARMGYKFNSRLEGTVKLLNIFDRKYMATAENEGFGTTIRPGTPFTATVGLEWKI